MLLKMVVLLTDVKPRAEFIAQLATNQMPQKTNASSAVSRTERGSSLSSGL